MFRLTLLSACVVVALAKPSNWESKVGLFDTEGEEQGPDRPLLRGSVEKRAAEPTANQLFDQIVKESLDNIKEKGWDISKKVQNGETDIPLKASNDGAAASNQKEKFTITSAEIQGFGSLKRSKSATYNNAKTVLTGTMKVSNLRLIASYDVNFGGSGEAPGDHKTGSVTETTDLLFADIQIELNDKLTPQKIISYKVRSGHDKLSQVTNLDKDDYKGVHSAGFRKGLRQVMEETMNTNIKVQINQAIQDMKAAGP